MSDVRELPMFPLGTVLFPAAVLPLHVFEPRYRELMRTCLAGDREFGIVLIERGNEVGGGDVRTDIGTVARIVEWSELPDGRWVLLALGTRRIRVEQWLTDDPYPRARVEDWLDLPASADLHERHAAAVVLLRRVLALRTELGDGVAPATVELDDDVVLAGHQACWLSPLGPVDKQRLLSAPSPDARAELLGQLLEEEARVLELRLARG